jgi:hypothetical protein
MFHLRLSTGDRQLPGSGYPVGLAASVRRENRFDNQEVL